MIRIIYGSYNGRIIYDSCNERIIYDSCNGRIILLVVPLFVVPTELTEDTEAYGVKLLESTERIDAARHTTDGTEMIVCVAVGGELCLRGCATCDF